jgi:hypothetical protein
MGAHPKNVCVRCNAFAVAEQRMTPGGGAAYDAYLGQLQGLVDDGRAGLLTKRQQDQRNTSRSNAQYLKSRIDALPATTATAALARWRGRYAQLLAALMAEADPKSVFTRDVDQGELVGQSKSGSTASVVDRVPLGQGRIRTYGDLNRGGGAGSYVRFLSNTRPAGDAADSAPLAVGKIGYSGITIIYDAAAVVQENAAPAHLLHNDQDSAGRVFGTSAPDADALARQSALSQRILGAANPNYYKPVPAADLSDAFILDHAAECLQSLLRHVTLGQTVQQEHNEQILISGASVASVKAILIHRPPVTPGRPPQLVAIPEEKIRKAQERADARSATDRTRLGEVIREREALEEELLALRQQLPQHTYQTGVNPRAGYGDRQRAIHARIGELAEEEKQLRIRGARSVEIPVVKATPRLAPLTDRVLRSKLPWEGDSLPDSLSQFDGKTGLGGVPIRFLFRHVNPAEIRRAELPEVAHHVYEAGRDRWNAQGNPA